MSAGRTGPSARGGGRAELQSVGSRPEFVGVGSRGGPGSSLFTQGRLAGLGCGRKGLPLWGVSGASGGGLSPQLPLQVAARRGFTPTLRSRATETRRTGCGNADVVDVVSSSRHGRGARCRRGQVEVPSGLSRWHHHRAGQEPGWLGAASTQHSRRGLCRQGAA